MHSLHSEDTMWLGSGYKSTVVKDGEWWFWLNVKPIMFHALNPFRHFLLFPKTTIFPYH